MNAPIIIEFAHKNVGLLYQIDFVAFKDEMQDITGVEIVDSLCFDETMLIGLNITCDTTYYITVAKKIKKFFENRWNMKDYKVKATFNNQVHLLDYKKVL